jgi:alpha-glucosidase (family GH31 glycosyl hydrolase)
MTPRGYMDRYSREEYRHGLTVNPEFVVMTRAVDDRYWPLHHPEGYAPLDAAPVTWVGDRTHEWSSVAGAGADDQDAMRRSGSHRDIGFEGALRDILASARIGYCVVGDDIAGYHGREPIPPRLYIRWAQFAAFTGFFLNGGHGERRLWKRTPEELEIVRRCSWLHTELVPYLYTHVVRCHGGAPQLIRPEGGRYQYRFGDDFFVAPIYRDSTRQTVDLPPGAWRPLEHDAEAIEGPRTVERDCPLSEFPVYVRDGAIIPMNVERAYTGFGDADSKGFQTWSIWPRGTNEFTAHQPDGSGTTTVRVEEGTPLRVAVTGTPKPHILRIRRESKPGGVTLDGRALAEGTDWRHDAPNARLWIRTRDHGGGKYEIR